VAELFTFVIGLICFICVILTAHYTGRTFTETRQLRKLVVTTADAITTRLDRIAFLLDPTGEADAAAARHKAQVATQAAQKQAQIAARASQQQAEVAAEAARQKAAADRERARIELAERENIAAQLAHLKGPAVVTPPCAGQ
jgi:hypothetical protein